MSLKLKEFIKNAGLKTIGLLNFVFVKTNRVVINTFPDYEGSGVAIHLELRKFYPHKIVWLLHDESHISKILGSGDKNTLFTRKNTLRGVYYFLTSRYIFYSIGFFNSCSPPKNQIQVNVWHGMPIKAIGTLDGKKPADIGKFTYTVATSPMFQEIMATCLAVEKDKVLVVGQPRDDLMFHLSGEKVWQLAGIDRAKYTRIFFWLPTYRQWKLLIRGKSYGEVRLDGKDYDNVFNMVDMDVREFEKFLQDNHSLCLVKPHPASPFSAQARTDSEHLVFINESWLLDKGLNLYHLLGHVDALITDISSVWIDYLILDRPIIICFPDYEEYLKSRTSTLKPYEDWMPGPLLQTYPDLLDEMTSIIQGKDLHKLKRRFINEKMNSFSDDKSTIRLLQAIGMVESNNSLPS